MPMSRNLDLGLEFLSQTCQKATGSTPTATVSIAGWARINETRKPNIRITSYRTPGKARTTQSIEANNFCRNPGRKAS